MGDDKRDRAATDFEPVDSPSDVPVPPSPAWLTHERSRYVGEGDARLAKLAQEAARAVVPNAAGGESVDTATWVTMRAAVIDDAMDMLESPPAFGSDGLCEECRKGERITALDYCDDCFDRLWTSSAPQAQQRERWKRVAVRRVVRDLERVASDAPGQEAREMLVDVMRRVREYGETRTMEAAADDDDEGGRLTMTHPTDGTDDARDAVARREVERRLSEEAGAMKFDNLCPPEIEDMVRAATRQPPAPGGSYAESADGARLAAAQLRVDEEAMVGAPHPPVLPPGRPFASGAPEPPYVPPSLRGAERHRQVRAGLQSPAVPLQGLQLRPAYDVDNIFTYHPPIGDQSKRYGELRAKAKEYAELVLKLVPASAERTLGLRRIEEATMWLNAAIARNEGPGRADQEEG